MNMYSIAPYPLILWENPAHDTQRKSRVFHTIKVPVAHPFLLRIQTITHLICATGSCVLTQFAMVTRFCGHMMLWPSHNMMVYQIDIT